MQSADVSKHNSLGHGHVIRACEPLPGVPALLLGSLQRPMLVNALAVFMNVGRVAGSATWRRVFTTSSGLVRPALVRPARIAEPIWTVITWQRPGSPVNYCWCLGSADDMTAYWPWL